MKFLCVPCDEPMKLLEAKPPDRGSIALVYACAKCGYEFAMLTNPHETQIVGSLGVAVAPADGAPTAAAGQSKCPFTGVVRDAFGAGASEPDALPWTAEARERLTHIPEFVRPMAKLGIEKFAREAGRSVIDGDLLDAARDRFGM